MEQSEFGVLIKHYFCVEKPYQKPRPSSINIIRTLLRRMEWLISGLPNFVVVVRAQKPYQLQIVQIRLLHQKWSLKSMILFWITRKNESTSDSWDRILLNWACGQYFAYMFVHEKALCKMSAAITHDQPKTHSCDHFRSKFDLLLWAKPNVNF